ncbi:hypothetical protein Nepgr_001782 [Nepenthes gracilis]|uniref:Kri1-like C-terminal domain-containing protein n=1 Tax=Nepenthes gracilis TaxID=150966 RepID=A0AAD3RXV3_NEPGR|nr:hypothetical protein Nepgr_001782 [Nepenthes gracilis]
MAIDLFDNSSGDDEEISKIEINEDFARRYEHNKKREDLHRLEEMKKKGLIGNSSSESESESSYDDDSDDMNSKRKEIEFFDALLKVRKKDPILKEKDAKLFASDSSEDEERIRSEGRGRKREKEKMAKYLKDVTAQHLLEEGPEFEEVKEDVKKVKSYAEEQEDLRQAFLDAVAEAEIDDGDGGEFLREKAKENKEEEEEKNEEVKKRLDEYFGEDDKLDEKEMFLKDFFKNKMWIDTDKGKEMMEEDVVDFSDEEEELEKQEDYEREYNFRFEENAGDRVLGHSRSVQGSVRKKENARKRQRQSKEERIALAELERKEEVKRLKNVKKKEIAEKLNRIREVAGLDQDRVIPLTADDLEEEFDPDDYDKKMKAAFGEDYYEADDADPEFGSDRDDHGSNLHKPNFDEEDELLGLPKGWDVLKPGDGFSAEREKYLESKVKNEANEEAEAGEGGWEDEEQSKEGKRKRKRKLSLKEKVALEKDLDELYKLDYEDTIGDLKTRFKYKTVRTRRYGLNAAELLTMDDKELNQYVSLKKLAPYSEKEWKVPRIKRYQMLLQAKMAEQINRKKQRKTYEGSIHTKETGTVEDGKAQDKQPSDNSGGGMSRRAKRRCRQAELKISKSRLIAYGKLPTTSKRKSKR